ncbi:MAG TPA: recombinase RecA [Firmicutes bacterium]|nr:recombinase RecA [Bacillota bacterium]
MEKDKNAISAEREKALELAIAKIKKEHGEGSIMRMSEESVRKVDVIPTGCLPLDFALGIGGMPKGRIVEIYGPESSGKTTLTLHVIAQAQKAGGKVAFVDAEHALDPTYAKNLGIDLNELYISQPDSGEQALNIVEELVSSGALDVIVVDSVAALTPKAEIDGEMEDSQIGLQARLMSKALRKLVAPAEKTGTCIIFINQLREKVGVFFGSPETTPGGKALKFYTSIRLDIRKIDSIKNGSDIIGSRVKVKVVKNKMAPPFKTAEFDIIYGKGISNAGCLIDLGLEYDIFTKSGSWFGYNGERICQGKERLREMLETNEEFASEVTEKIKQAHEAKKAEID